MVHAHGMVRTQVQHTYAPCPLTTCPVCAASTAGNSSCILKALARYAAVVNKGKESKHLKPSHHAGAKLASSVGFKSGLWLEFGVAEGGSAKMIAAISRRVNETLYAFDSFHGLPEAWRTADHSVRNHATDTQNFMQAGAFARGGVPPFTHPWISWRVGWFNRSLAAFLAEPRAAHRNVTFLHLDADLYSSTDTVLRLLEGRLSPGAVLCFDELINYPEFEAHEMRALRELQARTGRAVQVVSTPAIRVLPTQAKVRAMLRAELAESHRIGRFRQDATFQLW
jgi:predicted O-methyltransferase YrrM